MRIIIVIEHFNIVGINAISPHQASSEVKKIFVAIEGFISFRIAEDMCVII